MIANPCNGCYHAMNQSKGTGCYNRNRLARLISDAKVHLEDGRLFTAAQLLTAAGNMQLDFERSGYTRCTTSRSPNCYTYFSTDEDFNAEAGTL